MNNFIVPIVDTDSVTITKQDGAPFSEADVEAYMQGIAQQFPPTIKWDLEFVNANIVVLKSKNYIIKDGSKITIKGSGLKSSKIEPALKEMYSRIIDALLENRPNTVKDIYMEYINEAVRPTDISRWCSKKTITKPVLNSATDPNARANERNVFMALNGRHVQEGDKIYTYPGIKGRKVTETVLKSGKIKTAVEVEESLMVLDDWDGENHNSIKLFKRVYDSIKIFKNVIDMEQVLNYSLKKNQALMGVSS